MTRILDYDALFDETGRQRNICTDPDLGGSYLAGARTRKKSAPVFHTASAEGIAAHPDALCSSRRPVRCIDYDSFDSPDRTAAEARECLQKTAILLGSAVSVIAAIAILA